MSVLERAIAAVAPRYAVKRELARAQLKVVQRAAAPRHSRRGDSWRLNDHSTRKYEGQQDKPMARHDRALLRHVFEMNPFAVKTKSSLLNNLIGWGITGTLKGPKAAQNLWAEWVNVCDYDGVYDLYGLQALCAEIWLDDGEVFIVERIVPGAAVHPLRLQVLDIDQLDTTAAVGNGRVRDGIEYEDNKPVAYHFKRSKELGAFGDPIRVPADQVIHLFQRRKAGQWRGRPHFEPVLDVVSDLDDYLEAEGIRKKISACFVGFRAPSENDDDPAMGDVDHSTATNVAPPEEGFYPGMIINGRPGETMTFGEPSADGGLGDYMRWGGLRIAAGARTTYERATGDLSNVNFSSYKAGDLEFQRFIGSLHYLLFIPRLCRRIERSWTAAAFATGLVGSRKLVFKWTPPPFGSIDEGKDSRAKRDQVAAGQESLRNVVAERGYDLDELTDEIVADVAMIQAKFEAKKLGALVPGLLAALFGLKLNTGGANAGTNQPAS